MSIKSTITLKRIEAEERLLAILGADSPGVRAIVSVYSNEVIEGCLEAIDEYNGNPFTNYFIHD